MSEINVNSIDKESGSTLTLGGAGTTVAVHASATTSGFDSGLASVQTFTSSGTWTKPSGITKVIVEVQGAGGSGAKRNGGYVGAGAAGGYSKKLIDVSSISSATVTIGTGGAAVTATSTAGNSGGSAFGLTEQTPLLAEAVRVEMALLLIAVQLVEPLQVVI